LAAGRPCLGLEVNSPHLTADANASSSRLNYHVGRALVISRAPPTSLDDENRPRWVVLDRGEVCLLHERFSIFRFRAETWVFEGPRTQFGH
jgi:hypothetical protein